MKTLAVMCMALHRTRPFLHAALAHDLLDLRRDVHEGHPRRDVERQVFGVGFHLAASKPE